MNLIRILTTAAMLGGTALGAWAEDVASPNCSNADGSESVLYDVQNARFVNGLRGPRTGGYTTTVFLDCGSDVGFEVMHGGGMPQVLDGEGRDITPPGPLEIIGKAMRGETSYSMESVIEEVRSAGFTVRSMSPSADCLCTLEMRHAFD